MECPHPGTRWYGLHFSIIDWIEGLRLDMTSVCSSLNDRDPVAGLNDGIRNLAGINLLQFVPALNQKALAVITGQTCFFRVFDQSSGSDDCLSQRQTATETFSPGAFTSPPT